jgi:hypothetical protein
MHHDLSDVTSLKWCQNGRLQGIRATQGLIAIAKKYISPPQPAMTSPTVRLDLD